MKKTQKSIEELNIRSEEVQEVLGSIPHWILRYGILSLGIILTVLLFCSYFIKYPEIVPADITITTTSPKVDIVARQSGKLTSMFIQMGQHIHKGQVIGIIGNTVSYDNVCTLKELIGQYQKKKTTLDSIYTMLSGELLTLGELQDSYSELMSALTTYTSLDPSFHSQIQQYREQNLEMLYNISKQEKVLEEKKSLEVALVKQKLDRDISLKNKGLLSQEDYEETGQRVLQVEQARLTSQIQKEQTKIQMVHLSKELAEREREFLEQKRASLVRCHLALSDLWASIRNWEEEYLLYAPSEGIINFVGYWADNQNILAGDVVCSISPKEKGKTYARAEIPIDRSGKVSIGQRVIIRLKNYPEQEFGFLEGVVSSVSQASPKGNSYIVEINLPKDLITSYGKVLPDERVLIGNADIITQDLRLIERLLFPFRKIINHI